jgi:hypothetical protein
MICGVYLQERAVAGLAADCINAAGYAAVSFPILPKQHRFPAFLPIPVL